MSEIINLLKTQIISKQDLINDFFKEKFKKTPPIFYNSIDLRHSGFKIAPIDTNCFPAGFNNIKGKSKENAKIIAKNFIKKNFDFEVRKILIIPENHTRNLKYLENILSLQEILQTSQNQVLIGSMIDEIENNSTILLEDNKKITFHKIKKIDDKITTIDGFEPDLIILNNDLTGKVPEILQNIKNVITPATEFGWHQRSKSNHFQVYNQIATEISEIIEIDPWLISSFHSVCEEVDFKKNIGFQCLAKEVDAMLKKIKEKYQQHGIKNEPFCYIKADNGTYGMAVMQVNNGEDALNLNKKERNKMNMLKESTQTTRTLIQEGILTIDTIKNMPAEPMIYMIGGEVVGNLFRANQTRNQKTSLNAVGAEFFDLENLTDDELCLGCKKENMKMIYSFIAKIAAIAVANEFN